MNTTQLPPLKPITHTLFQPLASQEGKPEITELTFKQMTYADYLSVDIDGDDDEAALDEFLMLLTGLTPDQCANIALPDYNSVKAIVSNLITKTSKSAFEPNLKLSHDTVPLLVPIKSDSKTDISAVQLKVPTVKTRRIYKTLTSDQARLEFITNACTGLSAAEIGRLFMPDWNQVQANIDSFLNRPADYFLTPM
ncbi:phage tail assembly protein [Vibrio fluvialis]|nr:phage tail assembly protein [Vibrio fluvialis]MBY7942237.1 phage tail assembly protein [Vibrio fluvialis]MBY8169384.1 phage tail assembly protein [Vibrio fluvialis]